MPVAEEVVLAGKFLNEALTKYETTVDQPVYPEYWAYEGMYHFANADLPFGCRSVMNARMDFTGTAVNYGGKATSIPLANFGINMDEYRCMVGVLGADWNWQELRSEEASQNNAFLPQVRVVESYRRAVEMGLMQWMHKRAVFGDANAGFTGLITNPFVETIEVSDANNGLTGSSATAATAYDFMITQLSDFRKVSKLTSEATAVLTSEDVMLSLNKRFGDSTNDGNPFRLLTSSDNYQVRTIRSVNEMDGNTVRTDGGFTAINSVNVAANDDLLLMFDTNVETNMIRHYADIDFLPPGLLDDQLTYRQIGLCATSEVIYKKPFRARLYILKSA